MQCTNSKWTSENIVPYLGNYWVQEVNIWVGISSIPRLNVHPKIKVHRAGIRGEWGPELLQPGQKIQPKFDPICILGFKDALPL